MDQRLEESKPMIVQERKSSVFARAKNILLHPNNCWESIKQEEGIKESLKYIVIITVIGAILLYGFSLIGIGLINSSLFLKNNIKPGPIVNLVIVISASIFYFIGLFIGSGLYHLIIKMLKGQGTFSDTFKVFAYGVTPSMLLGSVPVVGAVAYIYSIFLSIAGISKLHNVFIWKVLVAYLLLAILPSLVIALPILVIAFLS